MRRSTIFLLLLTIGGIGFVFSLLDARSQRLQAGLALQQRARVVARLGLTDLALFTEARYTRHLSQADLHAALQDHPLALEHFPSGSLQPPPQWSPP